MVERAGWGRRTVRHREVVVVAGSLGVLAAVPFVVLAARWRGARRWLPAAVCGTGHGERGRVVHRALLSVDVEHSGDERRDSEAFARLRRVLFHTLEDAFEFSGISWSACLRFDTGDGVIVAVPAKFPKARLVYPMLERLAANLRHHNRYAGPAIRIRLRAAIHAGDVRLDDYGITGRPKVLLARLLDASPLRVALAEAPATATVAVLVSAAFHDDVICHGHKGIDPSLYRPVTVRVKETETTAWLLVPGHALPVSGNASNDADIRHLRR